MPQRQEAARVRALPLVQLPLESPITHAEYERVFANAAAATDALIVADTPENFANREKIAAPPAVYPSTQYARSGGLVGYGYDPIEGFRRAVGSERPLQSAAHQPPKKGGEGEEAEGELRPMA